MKKITLITASILALAAATVAAQTGDQSTGVSQPKVEVASLSIKDSPLRGAASNETAQNLPEPHRFRFVAAPEVEVNACDKVAWPYYPVE